MLDSTTVSILYPVICWSETHFNILISLHIPSRPLPRMNLFVLGVLSLWNERDGERARNGLF